MPGASEPATAVTCIVLVVVPELGWMVNHPLPPDCVATAAVHGRAAEPVDPIVTVCAAITPPAMPVNVSVLVLTVIAAAPTVSETFTTTVLPALGEVMVIVPVYGVALIGTFCGLTETLAVPGVVPVFGVTASQLPLVGEFTVTAAFQVIAPTDVLLLPMVMLCGATVPPGDPRKLNEAGVTVSVPPGVTVKVTFTTCVFAEPLALMVIVPLYVPALRPVVTVLTEMLPGVVPVGVANCNQLPPAGVLTAATAE